MKYIDTEAFKEKYKEQEVKLSPAIMTIYDSYPSPLSSGSNGYLTKIRVRNNKFEVYHDWWSYGWLSIEEVERKYPCASCKLNQAINALL